MMSLDWSRGVLAEGLRCYRAEEFFLTHEHWEGVWLKAQEPEKNFLQALIQIAAAFHHLQRGNRRGTVSLLQASLRRLESFPISFEGIEVEALREEIGVWLRALEVGEGPFALPFPRICVEGMEDEFD